MEYEVAFDVIKSGYRRGGIVALCLFLVVVSAGQVLLFRRQVRPGTRRAWIPRTYAYFCLGFTLLMAAWAVIGSVAGYRNLSSALREGRCEMIEGFVSDFHPMPFTGHDTEWFIVSGRRFEYSDYRNDAGFSNTASHGGPIRQGLQVRIHHVGNDIARLEVAR